VTRLVGLLLVAIACIVVPAGCGGGSGHGSRRHTQTVQAQPAAASVAAAHDTGSLVCNEDIALARPGSTGLQVVLGVVALPTAPAYGALQTSRTGMHGRLRLFAKTGLIIRPHTRFELVVPAALRRRMALAWGNTGDPPPRSRFIVNNCGGGETSGSRWLVYAGGYHVSRPVCASLVVIAHGRRRRVRIGVGTACPGQRPPSEPTQS
jgi:hypothetical protein